MFCAISGNAPENPVVSTKSGHLYEQSVVEKLVQATGKCPVTGEPMELSDLMPVKAGSSVKPRPVAASSIPGMLSLFQNEWDALMLEMYTLKQSLETTRQELGHALYQHDAACRVIARLLKERDDARKALAEAQPAAPVAPAATPAAPMQVEEASAPVLGMTPEVLAKFTATSKELSKGRKKRQPPADQASAEAIAAYTVLNTQPLHKAGPACVEMHASLPLFASGGADGSIAVFDCKKGSIEATLSGHSERVNRVRLHPTKPVLISCSADGTARCWSTAGEQLAVVSGHSAEVTDCSLHATGDYFVTASADKSWMLSDIERGSCILAVKDGEAGYSCAGFHPDGLILGTGTDKVVRIWDVKSQNNVASFEGHEGLVGSLAFSENGYYLATGAADCTVKLWDLRKLKNFHTITQDGAAVSALAFDYSGQFLSVASADVSVFETKGWTSIAKLAEHKAALSGVCFGSCAASLAAASADGIVKVYGSA